MKKILGFIAVAALMCATYGTYVYFAANGGSPKEQTLSQGTKTRDEVIGNISDGTFPNYTSVAQVQDASGVFTVTAKGVESTEILMRKGWVDRVQQEIKKVGRRRRTTNVEIPLYSKSSIFTINKREHKTPLYIITLEDGSKMGAAIDSKYVSKLGKGESVTLPIGKKIDMSDKVAVFCFGGDKIDAVYYALNDSWYSENLSAINRNAIIYAVIALIVLGGALVYFGGGLFSDKKEE